MTSIDRVFDSSIISRLYLKTYGTQQLLHRLTFDDQYETLLFYCKEYMYIDIYSS